MPKAALPEPARSKAPMQGAALPQATEAKAATFYTVPEEREDAARYHIRTPFNDWASIGGEGSNENIQDSIRWAAWSSKEPAILTLDADGLKGLPV